MTDVGDLTVTYDTNVWTWPSLGFRLVVWDFEIPVSGKTWTQIQKYPI